MAPPPEFGIGSSQSVRKPLDPQDRTMPENPYLVLDERFRACFNRTAAVEKLWSGARWTEGPAYLPAGRYLVFSDIPNNRILRFDECDGAVSVFRQPSNYANGHTVDRAGRLVSAEHGRRV